MPSIPALAFLALGIFLLVLGFISADSINSQFTRFFSGHPTDRSIWMIMGGIVSVAIGLGSGYFGRRT